MTKRFEITARHLIFYSFALIAATTHAQESVLGGQYIFKRRNEVFESYIFSTGNSFIYLVSGDMGTSYGEGHYLLQDNNLVLRYDSAGVAKRVGKKLMIIPTSTITLKIDKIRRKKFDLQSDFTGRIQTFKRSKPIYDKKHRFTIQI